MWGWTLALFFGSIFVSQSAMDFFAVALVLIYLFQSLKGLSRHGLSDLFVKSGAEWAFFAWVSVVVLGFAINSVPLERSLMRIFELKWILLFYVLAKFFSDSLPKEKTLKPWSIFAFVVSLYAVLVFFIGFDPIKGSDYPVTPAGIGIRTGGLLSNPMTYAHCYGMLCVLLLGPTLTKLRWRPKKELTWPLIASSVLILSLVLSFTRGAWAALAVSVLFLLALVGLRYFFMGLIVGGGSVGVLMALWEGFRQRIVMVFQFGNSYDSERVWIWKTNWEIFKDFPILGPGYWENKTLLPEYYARVGAPDGLLFDHAHNQYLHILAGTGSLGLLAFVSIFLWFLFLSIKTWRKIPVRYYWERGLILGSIGVQVFFLIGAITEGNFEHSKVKSLVIVAWALTTALSRQYRLLKN
jgi:O-antigen ligase